MGESIISNSEDPLSCRLKNKLANVNWKKLRILLVVLAIIADGSIYLAKQNMVLGAQVDINEGEKVQEEIKKEEVNVLLDDLMVEMAQRDAEKEELEKELYEMVGDYPVREMVPHIAKYDREIAALIVGIAKKESNWGKRSPLKSNGDTCYNYWGYKGAGSEGIAMGHGCFGTPEEAVDAIGGRIGELVAQGLDTPSKMLVWKCGRSCATHAPGSAEKWVSDVNIYYSQIVRG